MWTKLINRLYEKEGLTDTVLVYQLKVNEYRAKYDIPDSSMLNDDGFCQYSSIVFFLGT